MKYGDKVNYYEGIIVEITDGAVAIDVKGRLGYIKVPMRMFISDYEIKVGQKVGFNMSFLEQLGPEVDEAYVSSHRKRKEAQEGITSQRKGENHG